MSLLGQSGGIRSWVSGIVLFLGIAYSSVPGFANASIFVNSNIASCPSGYCQAASTFGLLVGLNDTLSITGTTSILNDIALKSGATITTSGTDQIGSSTNPAVVDFADT